MCRSSLFTEPTKPSRNRDGKREKSRIDENQLCPLPDMLRRPGPEELSYPIVTSWVCLKFEEEIMDKDRVVGSAKEIKGTVKQAVGKAVGDAKLESEGKADKIEGKVQNAIGDIKDT
jgi:uncharacterized protein YjbJ (UPF0337 family)